MLIGVHSHAGGYTRPASPAAPQPVENRGGHQSASRAEIEANPAYFRSITSISYGSLASAYQSFRTADAASRGAASPQGPGAIASGAGIPAALQAYGESMETDAD